MKQYIFFIFYVVLFFGSKTSNAQCPDYQRHIKEANALLKQEKYIAAINKLNTAKESCAGKSKEIDIEVEKVVAAIEKKKKEADDNAKKAETAKKDATNALEKLKVTSDRAVTILLREIDRNILFLEYDSTFQKCKVALELEAQHENVKHRIQEIAFWQVETDTLNFETPLKILALLGILTKGKSKATLQAEVRNIDAAYYENVIVKRYFPEMIDVQGGEFDMGSENGEDDQKPIHKVRLSSFKMAKTETTVWQYHLYLRANKLKPSGTPGWQYQGDNPMVYVSWYDGVAYANWLTNRLNIKAFYEIDKEQEDPKNLNNSDYLKWTIDAIAQSKGFRLPTEAEWEYAARGGNYHENFAYSGSNDIDSVAWYYKNSNTRTHSVATKKANALGIYDLTGNVWEWSFDWYGSETYGESIGKPMENPTGATIGWFRVYRGGTWNSYAGLCSITSRSSYSPDGYYNALGFRLCLSQ